MTPTLRLLQCEVDEGEEDSYLRLLYQNQYIKYVVIAAGVYDPDDMCFEPVITALLEPLLPEGTWNYASNVKSPTTGRPHLTEITQKQLPSVVSVWHSTIVDYLDITLGPHLTAGVYDAKCSKFDVPLVAKFALWEWEIDYFNHECAIYQSIEGHGIGPRFLGHIAEEGRVIGFLTELVTDQGRYARHATPADLDVCCQTLARLHNLGILHGDLNKHNFLITSNGATLIDFSESRHSEDKMAFDEETRFLKRQLCDPSRRGRPHSRSINPSPWQYHLPAVTEGVVDLSDDAREPNDEHEGVASKNATEI